MKSQSSNHNRLRVVQHVAAALVLCGLYAAAPAHAQDVRGLEVCTAEKQMDRRTSCLQANTEFLQGAIERNARDTRQKLDAAGKELASARNEIAALKAALAATQARLDKLEKAEKPAPAKAK
jgi:septal ring factor EnvC (AmiA/AmiB activator)